MSHVHMLGMVATNVIKSARLKSTRHPSSSWLKRRSDRLNSRSQGLTPKLVRRVTNLKEKENRRRLAVQRILEGERPIDVANSLKVSTRSIRYWMSWYREQGEKGLDMRPIPGAESKLNSRQSEQILDWISQDATRFGFSTNLWTSTRIVQLIREKFGVEYNPNYFCRWLKKREQSPQKPRKQSKGRDDAHIASWIKHDWPRIVKKGLPKTRILF
jgi:transposase